MNPMDGAAAPVLSGYRNLGGGSHGTLQLSSRPDTGLVVHPREVRLDRLHAHEQRVRHLAIRESLHDELRDLPLGGGELPGRSWSADTGELGSRPLRPQ